LDSWFVPNEKIWPPPAWLRPVALIQIVELPVARADCGPGALIPTLLRVDEVWSTIILTAPDPAAETAAMAVLTLPLATLSRSDMAMFPLVGAEVSPVKPWHCEGAHDGCRRAARTGRPHTNAAAAVIGQHGTADEKFARSARLKQDAETAGGTGLQELAYPTLLDVKRAAIHKRNAVQRGHRDGPDQIQATQGNDVADAGIDDDSVGPGHDDTGLGIGAVDDHRLGDRNRTEPARGQYS
jgi:hypothetical protein